MRKNLIRTLIFGAVAAIAVAGTAVAAKSTVVRAGNLIVTFNADFAPKKLPRHNWAPINFTVSGKFATADGTHPPAVRRVVIQTDKYGMVTAKGLAACKSAQLQARDTMDAKKACPKAIIGHGIAAVEVQFPDSAPFIAHGPLVLFNGGVKGGVTTVYIHAYVSVPAPTAIVTTIEVRKIHKGKYRYESDASVPTIAGGSGSVLAFNLTVNKRFTYKHKKRSYLIARCGGDRHFYAHVIASFSDGTRVQGDVTRTCKQRNG
jgi:hypothetical protein